MNPLSDRINNLSTSQTLAMAALERIKSAGKDIISLSREPDFNTPDFMKRQNALLTKITAYSPVAT
jgi:aspartate aminotransferase